MIDRHTLPVTQLHRQPSPAVDARAQDPAYELPPRVRPPAGAPNVLLVLIDDMGFGASSAFGGPCRMPTADLLAEEGLRYSRFHTTALCAPTRAALLTGRNHHSVGMRCVSNFNTGFPSMTGHISNHAATVAEVLHGAGYATFAVGKWHLCPMEHASAAGPYDQWPLQRGFDRFYGFLDGETDQFHPELTYDNHRVEPPASPEDGYHLSEDLVDHALGFVHDSKSLRPDRPFFLYLAFGATHAPHQAPESYLAKYRGRYDEGWDVIRERWFARQREMGLLADGAELAPRNPGVHAWDELTDAGRALAARLQEAFAAFLDHTDDQIGRLVRGLEDLGELENTILVVLSDNGASQEGGPTGVLHEMKYFNFIFETPEEAVAHLDEIGGPHSHANYPWGWAQAGNTPFRWYKQNTHEGGVHVPLVVHWPDGIRERGGVRHQFHHVSDLVPTLYDVLGVEMPPVVKGFEQMPITGTSMRYTFDAPDEPTRKAIQYFEMGGHRGLWCDGWKAVTRHDKDADYETEQWELYHVDVDPSECHDLATEMPDKLQELVDLWWQEAEAHGVLPLDDRTIELFGARFRERSLHPASRRYTYYPPLSPIPAQAGPAIGGRSWTMTAAVEMASDDDEGVLFATGTENSGVSFFVQGGRLVFDYNYFGEHFVLESGNAIPAGEHELGVRLDRQGGSGTLTLLVDGEPGGTGELPKLMGMMSSVGPSVGYDHGSPVSDRYDAPFAFTGRLRRLDIDVDPSGRHRRQAEIEHAAEMSRQ